MPRNRRWSGDERDDVLLDFLFGQVPCSMGEPNDRVSLEEVLQRQRWTLAQDLERRSDRKRREHGLDAM